MKAILLSAGYGKRLIPITKNVPKCLIKINGKHILEFWIDKLLQSNITKFIVNTHYKRFMVEKFINESKYKNLVSLQFEPILLGTAGTLIKNLDFFNGYDGLLMHVDNYCNEEISNLVNAHLSRPSNCLITMLTFNCDNPLEAGIVEIENGIVKNFYEKKTKLKGNIANGAIYILSHQAQKEIRNNYANAFDFSNEIINKFLGRIYTFHTTKNFIDCGTIENYEKVKKIYNK